MAGRDEASIYNGYPDPTAFLNATAGSVSVYNYHHYMVRSSDKGVVQDMLSPHMLGPMVDADLLRLTGAPPSPRNVSPFQPTSCVLWGGFIFQVYSSMGMSYNIVNVVQTDEFLRNTGEQGRQ